jgi:hypothetical protein
MECSDLYIDVALGNGRTDDSGTHSRNVLLRSTGRLTAMNAAEIDAHRKEAHRLLDQALNDLICKQD